MRLIAHRGNVTGPLPDRENTLAYIREALRLGYDVEVDVRLVDGAYRLGHDSPEEIVPWDLLRDERFWVHCKDLVTLSALKNTCRCFFHDRDDAVLTSKLDVWVFPGVELVPGCVAVLPEQTQYTTSALQECYGICTDFPETYRERLL